MDIKDRIVELRRVRGGELADNPANWREHPPGQRSSLQAIFKEIRGYQ